jgi:hypothetical protein
LVLFCICCQLWESTARSSSKSKSSRGSTGYCPSSASSPCQWQGGMTTEGIPGIHRSDVLTGLHNDSCQFGWDLVVSEGLPHCVTV